MLEYDVKWTIEELSRLSNSCDALLELSKSHLASSNYKHVCLLCDRFAEYSEWPTMYAAKRSRIAGEVELHASVMNAAFSGCCHCGEEAGVLFGKMHLLFNGHQHRIKYEYPDYNIGREIGQLKKQGSSLHSNVSKIVNQADIKIIKVFGTFDRDILSFEHPLLRKMKEIRLRIKHGWFQHKNKRRHI